jgi:outer membrane protein TolC
MKNGSRKLLVLITALAVSIAAGAPGRARTLDRRGAVREAMAQNPQVAAARAEEAAVAAQQRQVSAAHWPMVSFTAGVGPALTAHLVPGTAVQSTETQYTDFKFSQLSAVLLGDLVVIQPLYTFGKIALRGEAAARGRLAREAQTRMRRADVAFEVARLYEGYLLARDFERFFDETIHWLESTLETTQDKLAKKVANTSERDVLRIQSAIALATMGVNLARAGMEQARAGLVAYLGLPAGEQIEVAETELAPVGGLPGDFDSLLALARDNRPELIALRQAHGALDALARAEAAGFKPDVFVLGFVSAAYTPGREWIETRYVVDRLNHFIPGLMLGLRWEFQGGMAQARAREQFARGDVYRHLGEWADDGIPAEVRTAYEDVVRAAKNADIGNGAVKKAKQWMVQASADHTIGFVDIREVSDAVDAYVALRSAVLKARFDHNVAMAALSKATGTLDGDSQILYLAPTDDRGAK